MTGDVGLIKVDGGGDGEKYLDLRESEIQKREGVRGRSQECSDVLQCIPPGHLPKEWV